MTRSDLDADAALPEQQDALTEPEKPKRRGRPKKVVDPDAPVDTTPKKKRAARKPRKPASKTAVGRKARASKLDAEPGPSALDDEDGADAAHDDDAVDVDDDDAVDDEGVFDDEDAAHDDGAIEEETSDDESDSAPVVAASRKSKKSKVTGVADKFKAFTDKAQKTWPGSIGMASDSGVLQVPRISSGVLGLDIATFGGFPRGRFTRIYGREKSAKTGTCLNTVAQWQQNHCGLCYAPAGPCDPSCDFFGNEKERPGANALWIDAEHRLESMWGWVEAHGVDRKRMLYQVPPDGQHIVDFTDAAIRAHGTGIGLIVVDSIAHVTSDEEIKKATVKGKTMAVNAQLIARAIRKWTSSICAMGVDNTRKPTVILINQLRMSLSQFNSPEVQPGGKSLDYATALDIKLRGVGYHYIVRDEVSGTYEDKAPAYGSRWKPERDDTPAYAEIKYEVTQSGICPKGRYGNFNYWLKGMLGRHIGSTDNMEFLWDYIKRYNFVDKTVGGYALYGEEARTLTDLHALFMEDVGLQERAWRDIVTKMMVHE